MGDISLVAAAVAGPQGPWDVGPGREGQLSYVVTAQSSSPRKKAS